RPGRKKEPKRAEVVRSKQTFPQNNSLKMLGLDASRRARPLKNPDEPEGLAGVFVFGTYSDQSDTNLGPTQTSRDHFPTMCSLSLLFSSQTLSMSSVSGTSCQASLTVQGFV